MKNYKKKITAIQKQISTQRKNIKETKASNKIIKQIRNNKFAAFEKEHAFKENVLKNVVAPKQVGPAMASDIDVIMARSYTVARRQIPRNKHFMIYASCSAKMLHNESESDESKFNITSRKFISDSLNAFLNDLLDKIKKKNSKWTSYTVKIIENRI